MNSWRSNGDTRIGGTSRGSLRQGYPLTHGPEDVAYVLCPWVGLDTVRVMQELEDLAADQKRRNPLVLIGAAATAGVLAAGLIAFKKGNAQRSQQFMRARVIFQGVTVGIMAGSAGLVAAQEKRAK